MVEDVQNTPPIHDLLASRWSTRRFASTPLTQEQLDSLIEAARWAPSYGNRQPTRYVVVRDPDALEALHAALTRGNAYAKAAPVLIALCGNPDDAQIVDGKHYYLLDGGLALENLLLQAFALGLYAHPMGGFDESVVRSALGITEQVRVLALVAVGHLGRLEDLDERTRERELRDRTRQPHDRIRSYDRWNFDDSGDA